MCRLEAEFDRKTGILVDVEDDLFTFSADMEAVGESTDPQLIPSPIGDLDLSCHHLHPVPCEIDRDVHRLVGFSVQPEFPVIFGHIYFPFSPHASSQNTASDYC